MLHIQKAVVVAIPATAPMLRPAEEGSVISIGEPSLVVLLPVPSPSIRSGTTASVLLGQGIGRRVPSSGSTSWMSAPSLQLC
jgi:hypothetical protein